MKIPNEMLRPDLGTSLSVGALLYLLGLVIMSWAFFSILFIIKFVHYSISKVICGLFKFAMKKKDPFATSVNVL